MQRSEQKKRMKYPNGTTRIVWEIFLEKFKLVQKVNKPLNGKAEEILLKLQIKICQSTNWLLRKKRTFRTRQRKEKVTYQRL